VPTLSTAYILIDGGRVTSVESVSQTRPLPADKPELAAAHATAATLIGMQAVYLNAGSARATRAPEVIRACRAAVPRSPLFVGGGIRTPALARAARQAGADSRHRHRLRGRTQGSWAKRGVLGGLEAFVEAVSERTGESGSRWRVWQHSPAKSGGARGRGCRLGRSLRRRRCAAWHPVLRRERRQRRRRQHVATEYVVRTRPSDGDARGRADDGHVAADCMRQRHASDEVFARQIEALAERAICCADSTSGESPNVIRAAQAAKAVA